MIDNKVIEKIQKLLSLANSDNEHEAKNATTRANELLLKYNLSLQQIEDHQSEYVIETLNGSDGLQLKTHQSYITDLLGEFFFVRIHVSNTFFGQSSGRYSRRHGPRTQYKKVLQLVGTKENVQIATYIFQYLNEVYPKLWKDYYDRDSSIQQSHKKSYYAGLTLGIGRMLEATKWKVEEEMGLVLYDDPALKKFSDDITKGNTHKGTSRDNIDGEVFRDGVKQGEQIKLAKPIESTSTDNGLYLEGKKK